MNNWKEFKDFLNSTYEAKGVIIRSGLQKALPNMSKGTIDSYRSMLQKAGFLEAAGRGKYKHVRPIPPDITWAECFMLINNKNLDYLESVYNRKLRSVKKEIISK